MVGGKRGEGSSFERESGAPIEKSKVCMCGCLEESEKRSLAPDNFVVVGVKRSE